MTVGCFLLTILGGGAGAAARFLVDGLIMGKARTRFPWGILVVNVSGSLMLGLIVGLADSSAISLPWVVVLGGGVLGGYTTFSTAMVDTVRLARDRVFGSAFASAFGMLLLTVLAAFAGVAVGRAF